MKITKIKDINELTKTCDMTTGEFTEKVDISAYVRELFLQCDNLQEVFVEGRNVGLVLELDVAEYGTDVISMINEFNKFKGLCVFLLEFTETSVRFVAPCFTSELNHVSYNKTVEAVKLACHEIKLRAAKINVCEDTLKHNEDDECNENIGLSVRFFKTDRDSGVETEIKNTGIDISFDTEEVAIDDVVRAVYNNAIGVSFSEPECECECDCGEYTEDGEYFECDGEDCFGEYTEDCEDELSLDLHIREDGVKLELHVDDSLDEYIHDFIDEYAFSFWALLKDLAIDLNARATEYLIEEEFNTPEEICLFDALGGEEGLNNLINNCLDNDINEFIDKHVVSLWDLLMDLAMKLDVEEDNQPDEVYVIDKLYEQELINLISQILE